MKNGSLMLLLRFKRGGQRDKIFLATKFGFNQSGQINGKPEYVRSAAEKSLKRLGVDCIDLYYFHVGFLDFVVVHDLVGLIGSSESGSTSSY